MDIQSRFNELKNKGYKNLKKDERTEYSKLKKLVQSSASAKEEPVPSKMVNSSFKVGQTVFHKIKGDKFQVEEIRPEDGFVGRRINQRDPLVWYNPNDLYIK